MSRSMKSINNLQKNLISAEEVFPGAINGIKKMSSQALQAQKKQYIGFFKNIESLKPGELLTLNDDSMVTKEQFTDALFDLICFINTKIRNSSSNRTAQGRKRTKQNKRKKSGSSKKNKKKLGSSKKRRRRR